MSRTDWLLLLLGLKIDEASSPALDPVRVQKGMFLLSQEGGLPAEEVYEFGPYNWGPYSRQLRNDLNRLVAEGLVQTRDVPGYSWKQYGLSPAGADVVRRAMASAANDTARKLVEIKRRITGVSFTELLDDVYSAYPNYAVNSLFRS